LYGLQSVSVLLASTTVKGSLHVVPVPHSPVCGLQRAPEMQSMLVVHDVLQALPAVSQL